LSPPDRPETPFAEPWEAQAFALAVALADQGMFAWREFATALGAEIRLDEAGESERGYYELWLAALEKLLVGKGLVSNIVVDAREAAIVAQPPAHAAGLPTQ
jgi:nitrile hydratase accessory protein